MTRRMPEEDPMTTLPTCPREDCTATCDHTHVLTTGNPYPCFLQVGGSCTGHQSDRNYNTTRCYAPRTPQPQPASVVLPTVEEVVDVLRSGDGLRFYSDSARDILDLIAARLPVWQPATMPATCSPAWTPRGATMPDTTPADAIRVVRVRHRLGLWQWACLLCGEWSLGWEASPGVAADAGRAHYLIWHTNEPAATLDLAHQLRAAIPERQETQDER